MRPKLAEPSNGSDGNSSEYWVSPRSLGGSSTTAAGTRDHWDHSSEASSEWPPPPPRKRARLGQSEPDAASNADATSQSGNARRNEARALAMVERQKKFEQDRTGVAYAPTDDPDERQIRRSLAALGKNRVGLTASECIETLRKDV